MNQMTGGNTARTGKNGTVVADAQSAPGRLTRPKISGKAAEILKAIDKLSDEREEKIRRLQQAIESGNYILDPRKIAARMIEEL